MERRILDYLKYIESAIHGCKSEEKKNLRAELLIQIGFFAHERLVHLIVTVVFALLTMIAVVAFLITEKLVVIGLVVMLMVLLVPYIRHYFILENSVQKLYEYYDRLSEDSGWEEYKKSAKDGNK
ncbi:MAG: hypothetical protein IJB96_10770 [Lachnospira sp.]|nr:hypothetical protein [Lachnospira sp.]